MGDIGEIAVLVIEVLFAAVFLATLWAYFQSRNPLSRDVMLVFAAMASIFVPALAGLAFGGAPPWLTLASSALFLATPLLLLRVCMRIRDVRGWVFWTAGLAYVVSVIPILVVAASERAAWMALPAIGVFVAVEALAAWYLGISAVERTGAARLRLLTASVATALFAGALLLAGVAGLSPALGAVTDVLVRAIGLLAAFAYAFAFLPIRPLRSLWEAAAALRFTEALMDEESRTPEESWRLLADSARRATGATRALVMTDLRGSTQQIVSDGEAGGDASPRAEAVAELRRAAEGGRELPVAEWPALASSLRIESRGAVLSALGLETRLHGRPILGWVTPRRGLFASDDRELLEILGRRAVVFAERSAMLAEQEALNQRLAATNEALASASQAKSDFLASMSHELRTPLSAIIGFSSLMRDEVGDGERVSIPREWVEHVHSSGEHLLGLINDVLDLSKVEAGRLELSPQAFDLAHAVSEMVGGMRPLAKRRRIDLSFDVPSMEVTADRGRMRQILYNLVSNALKFTHPGGKVSIGATSTADEVRITIADTGIGIAPQDHERIFVEFQQVGDASVAQEGTGLGLALTRRLVEAHGGRIELESSLGTGSRFTVVLPRAPATQPAMAAPAGLAEGVTPMPATGSDILIIEDDPGAVRLLRTYLEGGGHSVRVAGDGTRGLAEARRQVPAAIVLDVLLPGIDGWEVLRELKADPRLRDVPVVVVTVVDERQLGLTLGAVDYFLKPVDREALLTRLSRYTFTTKVRERTVRVLVVDDDPTARAMVDAALRPSGFEVVSAASGQEGIERVRAGGIDLVICDLLMPDLDGFEVVATLHAEAQTRNVPILILTAHDLTDADKERLNGQIVGVLSKHVSDLPAELQRWLARTSPGGLAPAT